MQVITNFGLPHLSLFHSISQQQSLTMGADKELYKLELLSLVSRVQQELFNHTKLQDKSLAEFVISVSDLVQFSADSRFMSSRRSMTSSRRSWQRSVPTFPNRLSRLLTA